ncbi:hypothetical protein SCLCIDRAFT_866155 [Scleroderma citrinum Foug A]|uniref:Uncharacterized protein n=1 Tax=Scleroderma citrinum Foug A TaxID=1036808 RepID=A0A0C3DM32_9AGAM|nr:hypothetical protein SCLCIDRAFT_866155 [Scleroderma citrinum Foug A]
MIFQLDPKRQTQSGSAFAFVCGLPLDMGIALLNFNSDHHIPTLRAVDSGRIMRAFDPPRSACLLSTLPQSDHHTLGPRRDASVPVTPYNAVDQGHEPKHIAEHETPLCQGVKGMCE